MSKRSSARRCAVLLAVLALSCLWSPAAVLALTAHTLGDFQDVTVMEVSGSYDVLRDGQVDNGPRQAIAREFIATHGDVADFLVVFTNFDFLVPPATRAFYTPVRNPVAGIGLPLFDHSPAFSPDGAPLQALQGMVDMTNLAGHVLEPTRLEFETTLQIFTHELMHRWGAYVAYLDGDGNRSGALTDSRGEHWSFLLDAQGSSLYGNHWQDNDDGTFTSIRPERGRAESARGRVFSPLELYLMGLLEPAAVPDLLLLECPGIDADRLPEVGVTIPALGERISIEQIIAAEGPRVPAAASGPRAFNIAFVYAVLPGTWSADDVASLAEVSRLARFRAAALERFGLLTEGRGLLQLARRGGQVSSSNPGVVIESESAAAAPAVENGVAWLLAQQTADGSWPARSGLAERDTAAALQALAPFAGTASALAAGRAWLAEAAIQNTDFDVRRLQVLEGMEATDLEQRQNQDGGWGGAGGYQSGLRDTALALIGLGQRTLPDPAPVDRAVAFLAARQNDDGGWGETGTGSSLLPTALALRALQNHRGFLPEWVIERGVAWLGARQNDDGGFGAGGSTVYATAVALLALKSTGVSQAVTTVAADFLLQTQGNSGSWRMSVFETALAIQALYAARVAADLAVAPADVQCDPSQVASVPAEVKVSAVIRNLGQQPVAGVQVGLYRQSDVGLEQLDVLLLDLGGNAEATVEFWASVSSPGLHTFYVVADDLDAVAESDEWNNRARVDLPAEMQPPSVGFEVDAGTVVESAGSVAVTVRLAYPWTETIVVGYRPAGSEGAEVGVDFQLAGNSLSFAPGEIEQQLLVDILDDRQAEPDHSLSLELHDPVLAVLGESRHRLTILDDELPDLAILSPSPGVTADPDPLLQYQTTARQVAVTLDGQPVQVVDGQHLGLLAEGMHRLTVTAVNGLGLSRSGQVDFTIDTSLPTITIDSPSDHSQVGPRPRLDFSVSGAVDYRLLLDGIALELSVGELLGPLSEGQHELRIEAVSQAGLAVAEVVHFTVDARPPEVQIISPAAGYLRTLEPVLRYQTSEPGQAAVWLNGEPLQIADGQRLTGLTAGTQHLRIEVRDPAGNLGAAECFFHPVTGGEPAFVTSPGWPLESIGWYGVQDVDRAGRLITVVKSETSTFRLSQYAADGTRLWTIPTSSRFTYNVDYRPADLAVDSQGNIFVVGWGLYQSRKYLGFIAKYAPDGRYLTHRVLDTGMVAGSCSVRAVRIGDNGLVYVAGNTDNHLFTVDNSISATMFVAAYDADLNLVRGVADGFYANPESFYFNERGALAVTAEGSVLIAGRDGYGRMRMRRFDAGLVEMAVQIIGPESSTGQDIGFDLDGNTYVGGRWGQQGAIWVYDRNGTLVGLRNDLSAKIQSLLTNPDGTLYLLDAAGQLAKLDIDLEILWSTPPALGLNAKLVRDAQGRLYAGGTVSGTTSRTRFARFIDPRIPHFSFDQPIQYVARGEAVIGGQVAPGYAVTWAGDQTAVVDAGVDQVMGRWWFALQDLQEGEHPVRVGVVDDLGLPTFYLARIIVDLSPPTVSIASPRDGQNYTDPPRLDYTVSDGQVRVLVNGVELTRFSGTTLDSLKEGENYIRVESCDAAGNTGAAEVRINATAGAIGEYPLTMSVLNRQMVAGYQMALEAAQDALGNLYVYGETLDPAAPNGQDVFVAKFDPFGQPLARWHYGTAYDDEGGGIAVAPDGGFCITYNFLGPDQRGSLLTQKFVVAVYHPDGSLKWSEVNDSGANDQANDIELDAAGNVFVGGSTGGRLHKQKFGGLVDAFLIKYQSDGRRDWTRLSNEPGFGQITDLEIDTDGSIYALGILNDRADLSLVRYDVFGGPQWQTDFTHVDILMEAVDLEIGPDGGLYSLGRDYVDHAYYLSRHDKAGAGVWKVPVEAEIDVQGTDLFVAPDADIYITGYVADLFSVRMAYAGQPIQGGRDVLVTKHAPGDGRTRWSVLLGDTFSQWGVSLLPGRAETGLTLVGMTRGEFGGGLDGDYDLFLAELEIPVEPTGPELRVDQPEILTNQPSAVVSGWTSATSLLEVDFLAPVGSPATHTPIVTETTGAWRFTAENLVPDGEHRLRISATDTFGTTLQDVLVQVDTTAPLLQLDPHPAVVTRPALLLSGTTEPGGKLTIETGSGETLSIAVAADGGWNHEVTGLGEGSNLIRLTALDSAGNATMVEVVLTYQPPPPLALALSQQTLYPDERIDLQLSISNLDAPGGRVVLEEWFDGDGDGRLGAGEAVLRRVHIQDGLASRAPERPGDLDGMADGRITTILNLRYPFARSHATGSHGFRVSQSGRAAAASLYVVGEESSRSLAGMVLDTKGGPIPGAEVQLLDAWNRQLGFAYADAAGYYRLPVSVPEADPVQVRALAEGYAWPKGQALPIHLSANQTISHDLVLEAGTLPAAGRLVNAENSSGVDGVLIQVESDDHLAQAVTDANGDYALSLPAGEYRLQVTVGGPLGTAVRGLLVENEAQLAFSPSTATILPDLNLEPQTTLGCGVLADRFGAGISGMPLHGMVPGTATADNGKVSAALSDGEGRFCIGMSIGENWTVSLDAAGSQLLSRVGTELDLFPSAELEEGLQLRADPAEGLLTGRVLDSDGQPIQALLLSAAESTAGTIARIRNALDGGYRLALPAGLWTLEIAAAAAGFEPLAPLDFELSAGGVQVIDLTLRPAPVLENSILIDHAIYNDRKQVLSVEASSLHADAALEIVGIGPMSLYRLFKGRYVWRLEQPLPTRPAALTVSGPEGSVSTPVN